LLSALLAACATAPPPAAPELAQLTQARAAEAGQRWPEAAEQWAQAANASSGQQAGNYWVNSAFAWQEAGQPADALLALGQAEQAGLAAADQARLALLRGELALLNNDLDEAEFFLDASSMGLPDSLLQRLAGRLEELASLRADPSAPLINSATALAEELAAPGSAFNAGSGLHMLLALQPIPTQRLATEAAGSSLLAPWATLALDIRQSLLRQADLETAASLWASAHPDSPVDASAYMELAWQYGQYFTPPARIAVLLPASGGLSAAAAAIRDGITGAYLEHPADAQLDFIALGEQPSAALDAYQQAALDGYQFVIGPLQQEAVQLLVDQASGELPALLLNWPSTTPETAAGRSSPWFSISLSQQAESTAVAQKMLASGHRRVVLLLAEGSWGDRTEAAFLDAFLAGGGEVVALERFDAANPDHSAKLTRLLQIEDSRERHRRLQGALGIQLEFEPSRRDDFEAIFMAVDPQLGRQLKPQLRFFDAGEKPVFAMSRVYSGRPDPARDLDLNGVIIPGTRWAASQADADQPLSMDSLRGGTFGSLHALGRDAWNLLPWLEWMRADQGFIYPGNTGDLYALADGTVQREPFWLQFRSGKALALPPVPGDAALE
jgi:outer membrane PBP1 activator LpoA protein